MLPAVESLLAVHFHDQSVQKSATELVKHAVTDVIDLISKNEWISNATQNEITSQLSSIKLSVMFPDDILNLTKIESLYDEMDFNGKESLPELYMKLSFHNNKLRIKPSDHWITGLNIIVSDVTQYYEDINVLSEFV